MKQLQLNKQRGEMMGGIKQRTLINGSDVQYRLTLLKEGFRWYVIHEKGFVDKEMNIVHEFDTKYSLRAHESFEGAEEELKQKGFREIAADLVSPRTKLTGSAAIDFVESASDIKKVRLIESYGKSLLCEVEDSSGTVTQLENGIKTVCLWMQLMATKEGEVLPDYLLVNE